MSGISEEEGKRIRAEVVEALTDSIDKMRARLKDISNRYNEVEQYIVLVGGLCVDVDGFTIPLHRVKPYTYQQANCLIEKNIRNGLGDKGEVRMYGPALVDRIESVVATRQEIINYDGENNGAD